MKRPLSLLLLVLTLTGVYLYALPSTDLIYGGAVLVHAGLGIMATLLLAWLFKRLWAESGAAARAGWVLMLLGAMIGLALLRTGTPRPFQWLLWTHIVVITSGVAILAADRLSRERGGSFAFRFAVVAVAVVALGFAGRYTRYAWWESKYRVANPTMPPDRMEGEGDGPKGLFFPSSAQTTDGKKIPPEFFMKSQSCERCHKDIYEQWNSSMHRMSSFNNQWYRKSIEYMQDVVGTQPSKWCGGCHDPSVLFSGLMDTPIKEVVNRPEAHAGLGCMMCHSIVHVKSTMGQGDFVVEYPKLHELAASENPVMKWVHDFMVRLNPEPHRRVFLKPFHTDQTAEFCSSCHKVHLDVPVNKYRWVRGFNDYDNWQASGLSGQGARSFYYPPQPQKCADCHMPLVPSNDEATINGKVHSHRFPAANTAVPFVNGDTKQLEETTAFLKNGAVTLDIFAVSPAQPKEAAAVGDSRHEMSTTFAVGEEGEMATHAAGGGEASPITAPLGRMNATVRRGDSVRVDVVVRTRKVGHFFPGGTVDAFDVWVELKAEDDKGQTIFWSGWVEGDGKGPVEKAAHFYRSRMIDAKGNVINKRNAWANRALVYVKLIPPGAADTVRYRLNIPQNAGKKIKLTAKLHYRKFDWYNTQFAYAGVPDPHGPQDFAADYDNRRFIFTGDTSGVSGKMKQIPNLPIVTMAESTAEVRVIGANEKKPEPVIAGHADDWERWNDYGIGLLLQGDLKGAEAAFAKLAEIAPGRADGWVNMGRVYVQEGDTAKAREVLERAFKIKPELAAAHFFYARALRSDGEYDRAAEHLRKTLAQYPRDRVVRNELGRVLFLKKQYKDAIAEFEQTLSVDPEDLVAHYNLMLCYNGLGDETKAQEHQKRYLRFKADESSQALTGKYRQENPEDNNERQPIHEHEWTPAKRAPKVPMKVLPQRAAGAGF